METTLSAPTDVKRDYTPAETRRAGRGALLAIGVGIAGWAGIIGGFASIVGAH